MRVSLDEGVELAWHDHYPTPTALHGHGNQHEAEGAQRRRERARDLREQPVRRDYPGRLFRLHFDLGKLHSDKTPQTLTLSLKTESPRLILHGAQPALLKSHHVGF